MWAGPTDVRRRVTAAARTLLLATGLASPAWRAAAQTLEPPPESPEGMDYAAEIVDSLDAGSVELGLAAAGRSGAGPSRSRRVRFSDSDMQGALREGESDPLSGGTIEARGSSGTVAVGRLAPRWGRGLVLGSPGEPWRATKTVRGARVAHRARAGEGVWLGRGEDWRLEAMCGRFARRDLVGLRSSAAGLSLGAVAGRGRARQGSIAAARGSGGAELALDQGGRWRAEVTMERALGSFLATALARGGSPGFASLAEPLRGGPAHALVLECRGPSVLGDLRTLGALWRYRAGTAGSRAGVELERPLSRDSDVLVGFEEQHGVRRDRPTRAIGLRQGLWAEWRCAGPFGVGIRHELWGERAWVRSVVRAVSTASLETTCMGQVGLRVTHSVFRIRRGESLYLPEAESDRLVLRALSGDGERTRVIVGVPVAGGRLHAALLLPSDASHRVRPSWTLDWTRRARTRVARSKSP